MYKYKYTLLRESWFGKGINLVVGKWNNLNGQHIL